MNKNAIPILLGAGAIGLGAYLLLRKDYFKFENWHPAFDTVMISESDELTPSGKKTIQIENIATQSSSATYGSILIEESSDYGTPDLNVDWSRYNSLEFYFYTPSPIRIQVHLGDIVGGTTVAQAYWNYYLVEGWNYVEVQLIFLCQLVIVQYLDGYLTNQI